MASCVRCIEESTYNLLAIPFAAGALYPAYGILLRPEWAALLMSASTVIVTVNALLIGRGSSDVVREIG